MRDYEMERLLYEENQRKSINQVPMRYYVLLVKDDLDTYGTVLAKAPSGDEAIRLYDKAMGQVGWSAVLYHEVTEKAKLEYTGIDIDHNIYPDCYEFPDKDVLSPSPWLGIINYEL